MPVQLQCECGKQLKVPDQYVGKRVKCPGCSTVHLVKAAEDEAPAVKPAMLKFACACGKQMQAKAEFAGRTTKCPACGEPVRIPGGAEEEADAITDKPSQKARKSVPEDDQDERPHGRKGREEDDERDEEADEEQPRSKRKKAKAVGGSKTWIWLSAGGGVALLAVVGICLWLFAGGSTPDKKKGGGGTATRAENKGEPGADALSLVPADAVAFGTVRLAELWKAPLVQNLVKQSGADVASGLAEAEQKLGVKPEDIERITVVLKEVPDTGPRGGPPNMWVIVSASKPWDTRKLLDLFENPPEKKQNTIVYYTGKGMNGALYLPNPNTVVIAPTEQALKECMAQQEKPRTAGPLARAIQQGAGQTHLVLGGAVPQPMLAQAKAAMTPQSGLAGFAPLLDLQSALMTCNLNGQTLETEITAAYPSPDQARAAHEALLAAKQLLLSVGLAQVQKQSPQLADLVKKDIEGLKINVKESDIVVVSTNDFAKEVQATQEVFKALTAPAAALRKTQNNFKQLSLCFHDYSSAFDGALPTSVWICPQNQQRYSWRVAILPFIEQDALYKKIIQNGAWDSPANRQLARQMPEVFEIPGAPAAPGMTYIQGFTGQGMPLGPSNFPPGQQVVPGGARLPASFPDGTSNTILLVEAANAVNWMQPGTDIAFTPGPQGFSPLRMGNFHGNGRFFVAMMDGSTHLLSRNIDPKTLQALITPNGGEVIPPDFNK